MGCFAVGLLGCWFGSWFCWAVGLEVSGLFDCWVPLLLGLGCWAVGLLGWWAVRLLGSTSAGQFEICARVGSWVVGLGLLLLFAVGLLGCWVAVLLLLLRLLFAVGLLG